MANPFVRPLTRAADDLSSRVLVSVPPRVDLQSAHSLRRCLLNALRGHPARLVLDMSSVESLDVAAGAVLIGVRRRLGHMGGSLELVNVNARNTAVLRQMGLARFLVPSGDRALSVARRS